MNIRAVMTFISLFILIILFQNCGSSLESSTGTNSSLSNESNGDDGSSSAGGSGGTTTGGTASGGSASGGGSGGTTTGGGTSGGSGVAPVFQSTMSFNFRREERIVMPINSLMPLPYDINGQFTVLSIVSRDIYRIRKYLGNTIDVGTQIPVSARRGDTGFTLQLNFVATELLRERAVITLMSQATPNVLPQQITITIQPKDTDIVDAAGVLVFELIKQTYDGKIYSSKAGTTNLAPIGKAKIGKGHYPYPSLAQELTDGRTFVSAVSHQGGAAPAVPVNRGQYLNDKIISYSSHGGILLALAEDKNNFYYGGAIGDPQEDYIPVNAHKNPSPVGALKDIFFEPFSRRLLMLTESGRVYSASITMNTTAPRRYVFSNPVEISFGVPIIKGFTIIGSNSDGSSQFAFVSNQNRVFIQNANSTAPSRVVIDMSTESGSIDELYRADTLMYLRFSTGRHYSVVFNASTGAISNRYPCTHNPDFIMLDYWNGNYTVVNPVTGQSLTIPYR